MPHSSGGGSHGGGFHGGSSSGSSGSSTRYSNKPFAGATCYVYYGRNYAPRLIYTNSTSINNEKVPWFSFIFMSIIFLFPIALFLFTGYHHPEKLKVDYDTFGGDYSVPFFAFYEGDQFFIGCYCHETHSDVYMTGNGGMSQIVRIK